MQKFGSVTIYRSGESGRWMMTNGRVEVADWGECYAVNCPLCGDQKKHLWISHLWGTTVGGKTVFPAMCYRRQCLSDREKWKKLFHALRDNARLTVRAQAVQVTKIELQPIELPAGAIPLHALADDHPAIEYVRQRGFDPVWLYKHFKVHVFEWAHPDFGGRILIPVIVRGQIVGWQARTYINDRTKYLSAPGVKLHATLYNIDLAERADLIVIVEGMIDAWRVCQLENVVGVSLFGKSMSIHQAEIVSRWLKNGKIVCVCLDADAHAEQDKICKALPEVHPINLTEGDPDENLDEVCEKLCTILETIRAGIGRSTRNECQPDTGTLCPPESSQSRQNIPRANTGIPRYLSPSAS